MTLFGTDRAEKELVFQVQIMLIEAQFFPLRAQEHNCKKKRADTQQIFSYCIFYITSKAIFSLLNYRSGVAMVASALLAPSLHIRRIYLYGVVKQYGQAMKSKVIKCVKSPTNFFMILFLAFLHYL